MENSERLKVSIIVSFLNVEQYIEETLESVLKQTYQNWEMWLIDDGSADKSTIIAKKYAADYPDKVYYVEHENHQNKGQSASRNVGVKLCRGEFVTFLDSDDVWLPNMLAEQVSILEKYPSVSLVCQASKYWYSWNNTVKPDKIVPVGTTQDAVHYPPQLLFDLYPLGTGAAPCPCGFVMRKDAFMRHGGFENTFRSMYDDQVLLVKFYLQEEVYISSRCDNWYRQREGSLVAEGHKGLRVFSEKKRFLEWLKQYLKKKAPHHAELQSAFQKEYKLYRFPSYQLLMTKGRIKEFFAIK